jgi:predicted nucleic acid-binding protein
MRFLDTSFVIAMLRQRERHHAVAAELWRSSQAPVLTTQAVVGEVWTFMRRREHHDAALVAVAALQRSPRVTIIETEPMCMPLPGRG